MRFINKERNKKQSGFLLFCSKLNGTSVDNSKNKPTKIMSSSTTPSRIHFIKSDWKLLHHALNAEITSMVENEYTDWNSYDADVIDWYTSVDDWDSQCKDKSKPIKHYNTDNPDVIEYYDEKQLIKKMDEFYELHHLQIKMGHKCPDLRTHYSVMNDVILKWEKEFGLKSRIKQKKKKAKIAIIAPPEGEEQIIIYG